MSALQHLIGRLRAAESRKAPKKEVVTLIEEIYRAAEASAQLPEKKAA